MFARYSFGAFLVATAVAQICSVTECHGVCGPMIVAARACAENSSDDGPWDNDCLCGADSNFLQNYEVCMSCGISLWQIYGSYLDGPLAECQTLLTSPTGSVTPCETPSPETSESTATEEAEETTSTAEETTEDAEETTSATEETTEETEETTEETEETTEETEETTEEAEETTEEAEETTEEAEETTEEAEETTEEAEETTEEAEETTSTAEETSEEVVETTEDSEESTTAGDETTVTTVTSSAPSGETTASLEETFTGMGTSLRLNSILALVYTAFTSLMML